jgi:anti-sigma factor RsiW
MKSCEYHEEQLSAWLDGELEREGQMELLDHLVFCESCRRFHAEARALDGLVAAVRAGADAPAPSVEIWERIQVAAERPTRRRAIPAWALRAAAVLVLAAGLGSVFWFGSNDEAERPAEAIVHLGDQAGQMTDARFVELTQEVLRAEPRYRTAMYHVMDQVMRDTEAHEASIEYDEQGEPAVEGSRADGLSRLPV